MYSVVEAMVVRHAQIVRFLFSGGTAFVSNIAILYLFTGIFHVWYLASSVAAFVGAFVVSFSMQKLWTFKNREIDGVTLQIGMSLVMAVINLLINTLLMYVFVEYANMHYLFAQVCAAGLLAIETYFVYKYLIFKPSKNLELTT